MSSSSESTGAILATTPPTGWTNEKPYMYLDEYWKGDPGDVKDMMATVYGLQGATPIWTHEPMYGNILFIFQATPRSGKLSYYVWNGIESSVCFIDAMGIGEIQATINKLGENKGYLKGLKLTVVQPL